MSRRVYSQVRLCVLSMVLVAVPISVVPALAAEIRDDYELTVAVVKKGLAGWELYRGKKLVAPNYTDTDPASKVRDFWCDGRYAKLDRDDNAHHETIFVIEANQLVYVGSLGVRGTFVDVARAFGQYKSRPLAAFVTSLDRKE